MRPHALRLAEEAETLAARLNDFAAGVRADPTGEAPEIFWSDGDALFGDIVQGLLAMGRRRSEHLDRRIFAEPSWEMLLSLFAAHLRNRSIPVDALVLASGIYPSTAHRWLDALVDMGLVTYEPEAPLEATHARLSDPGALRMNMALLAMQDVAQIHIRSSPGKGDA